MVLDLSDLCYPDVQLPEVLERTVCYSDHFFLLLLLGFGGCSIEESFLCIEDLLGNLHLRECRNGLLELDTGHEFDIYSFVTACLEFGQTHVIEDPLCCLGHEGPHHDGECLHDGQVVVEDLSACVLVRLHKSPGLHGIEVPVSEV